MDLQDLANIGGFLGMPVFGMQYTPNVVVRV